MINKDSTIAQQIVSLKQSNHTDTMFHNISPIYIKSNERTDMYQKYLENRSNVMSVIGSSDQIINMILGGSKKIDAFDISIFPKYYMYLKLAAIKALNKEDYINFFYDMSSDSDKYDDMYFYSIRDNLDSDNKYFWDSLLEYFDWDDITSSPLFSSEPISISNVIEQNPYLNGDNYDKVKELIDKVNINTFEGNITKIDDTFEKYYDLVYLSNIINYTSLPEYKRLLETINLRDKGIILTYLYGSINKYNEYFNSNNYMTEQFEDSSAGVLIKKKTI